MEAMFFNGSNSFLSNLGKAIHGLPITICANYIISKSGQLVFDKKMFYTFSQILNGKKCRA